MNNEECKKLIPIFEKKLGLNNISVMNIDSIDYFLPFIEKMKNEGAVVVIKFDGERTKIDDSGSYTVLVSGQVLNGDFIRTDSDSLKSALVYVIGNYGEKFWL